jgi:hypothetical protein
LRSGRHFEMKSEYGDLAVEMSPMAADTGSS